MDTISNYVAGLVLWNGARGGDISYIQDFSYVTLPTPASILQYYYNYKAMKSFAGGTDITYNIWWQFVALVICSITQPGQKCYNNAWAKVSTNSGKPKIKYQGAYAVLDLWTWSGWIEAYAFFFFHDLLKQLLAGTVIAIGFAFVYGLSSDLPLCVEGDIVIDNLFVKNLDLCTYLGLDTDTIDMRRYGGNYVKDKAYEAGGYDPEYQKDNEI